MKDWKPTAANKALHLRARLNALIRKFFAERGVIEVETPILSVAGNTDANIESFSLDFQGTAGAGAAKRWLRTSPEGQALVSPYPSDDAQLALGEQMFGIYCTPCHGVDGVHLGPVAAPGRLPGVVPLAGPAGVAHLRTDGWIYLTIRNGGAVMPTYGWAMSDKEMWSVVAYVRTLENAAAPAPQQENAP